jgi:hypothetical protein
VRLLAAAEVIRQSLHEDLRPAVSGVQERIAAELQERLGDAAYRAAWEEGRALSPERAVAEARGVLDAISVEAS